MCTRVKGYESDPDTSEHNQRLQRLEKRKADAEASKHAPIYCPFVDRKGIRCNKQIGKGVEGSRHYVKYSEFCVSHTPKNYK